MKLNSSGFITPRLFIPNKKYNTEYRHGKEKTYHDLRHLRSNKDIVLLSVDKHSSVVDMKNVDYVKKVNGTTDEGIQQGKYETTTDTP